MNTKTIGRYDGRTIDNAPYTIFAPIGAEFLGLHQFEHEHTRRMENTYNKIDELPEDDEQGRLRLKKRFLKEAKVAMDSYMAVLATFRKNRLRPGMALLRQLMEMEYAWAGFYSGQVGWTPDMHRRADTRLTRLGVKIVKRLTDCNNEGFHSNYEGDVALFEFRYVADRMATLRDQYYRCGIENMAEFIINKGGTWRFRDPEIMARTRYYGPLAKPRPW